MNSPDVLTSTHFDSIVVGGGMAGLAAAKGISEQGMSVALVEKRVTQPARKSLFVNGDSLSPVLLDTLRSRDGAVPCRDFLLINVDHPERSLHVADAANTYAISHDHLIQYQAEHLGPNVTQVHDRVVEGKELSEGVSLDLKSGVRLTANTVVDAAGSYSSLSRHYTAPDGARLLTDNPLVLWVRGVHGTGDFRPGVMINPMGRDLGLSWVMGYSETEGDIVAADNSRMFGLDPRRQQIVLDNVQQFSVEQELGSIKEVEYGFSSVIRAEPISRSVARRTRKLYAVGDAAGMGEPHMNEVIPAALDVSERVGTFIAQEKSPAEFYQNWRREDQAFPYDKSLAMLYRRVNKTARGEYGSGAVLYQALAEDFPPNVQQEIFKTRKLRLAHAPYVISAINKKPGVLSAMAEIGWEYAKVKAQNALER